MTRSLNKKKLSFSENEISEYQKRTGLNSLDLWRGTHLIFKNTIITQKQKNTGLNTLNLWNGKHKYFK